MGRNELLEQVTILDFMVTDLNLYLNTHPRDTYGLELFNVVTSAAEKFRKEYECQYGPLTACHSQSTNYWDWVNDPWPWNEEFNFKTCGCEMHNRRY